jgi:hypothetical protein
MRAATLVRDSRFLYWYKCGKTRFFTVQREDIDIVLMNSEIKIFNFHQEPLLGLSCDPE